MSQRPCSRLMCPCPRCRRQSRFARRSARMTSWKCPSPGKLETSVQSRVRERRKKGHRTSPRQVVHISKGEQADLLGAAAQDTASADYLAFMALLDGSLPCTQSDYAAFQTWKQRKLDECASPGCSGRAAPIGAESPLPADQVTTAALCLKWHQHLADRCFLSRMRWSGKPHWSCVSSACGSGDHCCPVSTEACTSQIGVFLPGCSGRAAPTAAASPLPAVQVTTTALSVAGCPSIDIGESNC